MNMSDFRETIDKIDAQIVNLFAQRMETVADIARYKKEHNLPILDAAREREKLQSIVMQSPEAIKEYAVLLYSLLFELSRSYQGRHIGASSALREKVQSAIRNTPPSPPENAPVACMDADSRAAAEKLFRNPRTHCFPSLEAVFSAVESGECEYGIVPRENRGVYDSLQEHGFYIVRNALPFLCISKRLEIYPDSNRTSLLLALPNEQGSLYKALSRFCALGINLSAIESRPVSGRDSESMFYIELDVPVGSPNLLWLLDELPNAYASVHYLGSYSEVH